MPSEAEIRAKVRQYITSNFYTGAMEIDDDTALVATGAIDSTGVFELIDFLEKCFGIQVPDEDLMPDNLGSIERICLYVVRRTPSRRYDGLTSY